MSEPTTGELSRRIAEYVGDAGFMAARTCLQGHSIPPTGWQSGDLCPTCVANAADEAWADEHIGWAIPYEPRPYAESLNLLVPVVEEWCDGRRLDFHLSRQQRVLKNEIWWSAIRRHQPHAKPLAESYGETGAESLARAFLAALEGGVGDE